MSLILEALKRSEAERQLGQAPGLNTAVRMNRRRFSPHLWWGLALLTVLIAAAFFAWRLHASAEAPGPGSEATQAMPEPVATDRPANGAVVVTGAQPADATQANSQSASTVAEQAPVAHVPDSRVAASRETAEFVSIERESAPVPAVPPTPAQIHATAPTQVPEPEAPAAPATLTSAPDMHVSAPAQPVLPRRRDLTPSERDALPALKLSMHVYTESVESRFVLIDGRRYEEGGGIAPSLIVEEITRDGAILNFNQKRFLLPRP